MRFLRFETKRLAGETRNLLTQAARELSSHLGEDYTIAGAAFGRFHIAEFGEFVLTMATTNSRPSTATLVGIDGEKRTLLPSIRKEDYERISEWLRASVQQELKDLVYPKADEMR